MRCNCGKYDDTKVIERGNEIHSPQFCGGRHAYQLHLRDGLIRKLEEENAKLRDELQRVNAYCQEMENRNWKGDRVEKS